VSTSQTCLELSGHDVSTVQRAGWAGVTNSKLLARIQGAYDAFITIDKNLPSQQKVSAFSFGVIVLRAPSNRLEDLKPLVAEILIVLATLKSGELIYLPANQ
jgi:hypothetical protein